MSVENIEPVLSCGAPGGGGHLPPAPSLPTHLSSGGDVAISLSLKYGSYNFSSSGSTKEYSSKSTTSDHLKSTTTTMGSTDIIDQVDGHAVNGNHTANSVANISSANTLANISNPANIANVSSVTTLANISSHTNGHHTNISTSQVSNSSIDNKTTVIPSYSSPSSENTSLHMLGECGSEERDQVTALTPSPLSSPDRDDSLLDSLDFPPPAPPQVDKPSALRLAKRLYNLEGFKKQDVSRQLSKKNDFSNIVAESYFHLFDFSDLSLDLALRTFLSRCILVGETQERERVLMYFSQRFLECNPELLQSTFRSQDSLHTLSCAVVLLNTDLHNLNLQMKQMTPKDFVDNLTGLNDGLNFPSDILYSLYTSILNQPLDWSECTDTQPESQESSSGPVPPSSGSLAPSVNLTGNQVGGFNPFLALPDSGGVEYKKGYIVRKCCYDANGKKTKLGKRSWKMFYVTLRDLVLFCFKDEKSSEQPGAFTNPQVALRLHSSLAHKAVDYRKRKHVFRLVLADRAEFLFRTTNEEELDSWVTMINTVVSRYSSPPLPAGCSSSSKFQRPLFPSSCSQLNLLQQLKSHQEQLIQIQSELAQETALPDDNNPANQNTRSTSSQYNTELVQFLLSEKERYGSYIRCLENLLSTPPTHNSEEQNLLLTQTTTQEQEHQSTRYSPP